MTEYERNVLIEQCAVAAEAQDRAGYEWVQDSLWANILRRAGANVRKLKSAAPGSQHPSQHSQGGIDMDGSIKLPPSPIDVLAPASCVCGYGECCVCPPTEKALRAIQNSDIKMTPEQREWCLDELSKVEGYAREEHVNDFDRTLARTVLSSWVDYCRDKGLM